MGQVKKIGVLTSGGDSPGMNAALRAVVRAAIYNKLKVVGIKQGYHGMIRDRIEPMTSKSVSNIIHQGGTILKSARSEGFRTPEGRKKAFEEVRKTSLYASLLGCHVVDIGLPPHEGNISLAKRDFGEICKMAADYGLNIALEFFGFGTQVKDMKTSRIVVEEPPNGGISLDTHHFYRGGSTLKDLEAFPIEKILTAHFCDFPRQWTDPGDCWDRPLPGEGVAPIKEIIDILKNKGYSGYYTLEVLNYELWGKDPGEVARIGKKTMEDLLGG